MRAPLIIPKPVKVTARPGAFVLVNPATIGTDMTSRPAARMLAAWLSANGREVSIVKAGQGNIALRIDPARTALGDEGYHLTVKGHGVAITAPQYAGLVNGIMTFRQLLPPAFFSKRSATRSQEVKIPCLTIEDRPAYPWRGLLLDVARYFLDKDFVLHYLDIMAEHKLNVLQLHLIDDCGWRVEIKKYPKLTEIGGFRGEGPTRQGGFYTRKDIREMVAYAAARNITLVPEIELPAHTLSAIVAYPWLACTGKQQKMPTVHDISDELYCPGKKTTWTFLNDVMDELCELFPSTYIHIGGDEVKHDKWKACPDCQKKIKDLGLKDEKALQTWMTCQVEAILKKRGRRIIGWDEILAYGVSTNAGLMVWRNPGAAVDGAKQGHAVVMALARHCYFDTVENKLPGAPPGAIWTPPVSLQDAYDWNPTPPGLTPAQAKNIIGAQGCLWTDQFLHNPFLADLPALDENRSARYVEYFTLPRAAALAEVTWTPREQRNWNDFSRRMTRYYARYAAAGWNYRLPPPEVTLAANAEGKVVATAVSPAEGATIHYTVNGSFPTPYSPCYIGPVTVDRPEDFKAVTAMGRRHQSLAFEIQAGASPTRHGDFASPKPS